MSDYSPNDRLKEFRKELGMNQEEMANVLGLKQGSYSDIERGRVGVTGVLTKLIKLYKINPVWLIEGEGEKTLDISDTAINEALLKKDENDRSREDKAYKNKIFELIEALVCTEDKEERKRLSLELKITFGRFILENSKLLHETGELKDEIIKLLKKSQSIKNILSQ